LFVDGTGLITRIEGPSQSSEPEIEGPTRDGTQAQQAVYNVNGQACLARDLPRQRMQPLASEDAVWYGAHEMQTDYYAIAPIPPKKKEKTNWTRFYRLFKKKITVDDGECGICMDKIPMDHDVVICNNAHPICMDCATSDSFKNNHGGVCPTCRDPMDAF
jgi:hypothetical protein